MKKRFINFTLFLENRGKLATLSTEEDNKKKHENYVQNFIAIGQYVMAVKPLSLLDYLRYTG